MDMFEQDELVLYHHPMEETSTHQTYGEVVRDLIMDEKQYLRDLHMITKVLSNSSFSNATQGDQMSL
jgi:hypothetical protein